MKLILQGTLPTMNEIIAISKKHHMRYSTMKKEYTELVAWTAQAQKVKPFSRADFIITWYVKDKRKNQDNISGGGTKFILDGLQMAGVITNDGWSQIGDITHKFAIEKNERVEIEIIPV